MLDGVFFIVKNLKVNLLMNNSILDGDSKTIFPTLNKFGYIHAKPLKFAQLC